MVDSSIYREIAERTGGTFMLGVVGPVRTGKSTFIKRFMDTMIIPKIEDEYTRERARDELPQSGSGRMIMTAEPKFIPEEAVNISFDESAELTVRMIDCVGYMVEGAAGQYDDGHERMVTTPWYDHEVSLTDAAEKGTYKVINEHSTVGILVTTDGSVCDIAREKYIPPEERVVNELKSIGKPFVILLNSVYPSAQETVALAESLSEKYGVKCIPVNCTELEEEQFREIIYCLLEEFPLRAIKVYLPEWLEALPPDSQLRSRIYGSVFDSCRSLQRIYDVHSVIGEIENIEEIDSVGTGKAELGSGIISLQLKLPRELYYRTISEETGLNVNNDADLISTLTEMGAVKADYDRLKAALMSVRSSGYGVVMPSSEEMHLEEPQIIRQGGKYSVRLKASAPAIHMMMTNIETEVTPAIGGETASEDIINFLLQGFDGDVNKIWQSNIFGKSLYDIAEEGLSSKIEALPLNARQKLKDTLQRVINEGCGGLICILL